MNNISINKQQASLSIDDLLLQSYPQHQQNWLLTYLDVFVLIIMLVVTLIALSDFESEQQIKRAETLQQLIHETSSFKNAQQTINSSNINESSPTENLIELPFSPTTTEKNVQSPVIIKLSTKSNEVSGLIEEKTIEYIPHTLIEKHRKSIANSGEGTQDTLIKTKEKILDNKFHSHAENISEAQKNDVRNNNLTDKMLQNQLQDTVKELGLAGAVDMKVTRGYAQLEIQDKILFKSSESQLLEAGEALLTKLTPLLTQSSGLIHIEGHTDNRPIKTAKFPSNWELGASRATSVLHFLASQNLAESRLRAITYADTKPLADNNTKEGREKNRRVSIVIKVSK